MPIEGNAKSAERWLGEFFNDAVMEVMDPDKDHPLSLLDKLAKLDYMAESQVRDRVQFSLSYIGRPNIYVVYHERGRRWDIWRVGQRGAEDCHLAHCNSSAGMLKYVVNNVCAAQTA